MDHKEIYECQEKQQILMTMNTMYRISLEVRVLYRISLEVRVFHVRCTFLSILVNSKKKLILPDKTYKMNVHHVSLR